MQDHIKNKIYHVEILPPKQNTEKLKEDLDKFANKYRKVLQDGYCACITDNSMGNLAFQGSEIIEVMSLPVDPELVMIHLNTFHTKKGLDGILDTCRNFGIKYLLVVSGDGSTRLPKLKPSDVGYENVESVTSVELLKYIEREYPGVFHTGAAFNPYEPEEHEFNKMDEKIEAGARFAITQPFIEKHPIVDKLIDRYSIPIFVEAWMSKKIHLLSDCVGYPIPENTLFDPIENLKTLHANYPNCGVYLAILGFKSQYPLLKDMWP